MLVIKFLYVIIGNMESNLCMRKWRAAFLSILLVFSLSACGQTENSSESGNSRTTGNGSKAIVSSNESSETVSENKNSEETSKENQNSTKGDSHVLIAYFAVPEDEKTSDNDAIAGASIVVRVLG